MAANSGVSRLDPFPISSAQEDMAGVQGFVDRVSQGWNAKSSIFRGQGNAEWALRTTLERVFEKWSVTPEKRRDAERFLLKEFIRRAHHYLDGAPSYKDTVDVLEWLSLMQHFRSPTRLLDWSYSVYFAVFMAVDSLEYNAAKKEEDRFADSAIWITDADWCRDRSNATLNKKGDLLEHDKNDLSGSRKRRIENFHNYIWDRGTKLVYPSNSFRLNERLAVQQGVFLCPGDATTSFEENWLVLEKGCKKSHRRLAKCVIRTSKSDVRERLIRDVQRMGINRAQVYPGLQGFAESLEQRLLFKDLY